MTGTTSFTTRTGNNEIDGLLMGIKYQTASGHVLTYSFPAYSSLSISDGGNLLRTAGAAYQNAVRSQLSQLSRYINVTFQEVSGAGESGDIKFSVSAAPMSGAAAYAYYPGGPGRVVVSPDYVVDGSGSFHSEYGWLTLLHETGHALGLKHPFEADGYPYNGSNDFPVLAAAVDTTRYTVMSYNNNETVGNYTFPQTDSILDIQALQFLYGANASYNNTATTYTFNVDTAPAFETLWDGGGTDTIRINSGYGFLFDLHAGKVNALNNVFVIGIAYNAQIENLVTGSGDDTLIGNDLGNVLDGKAGADTQTGGLGDDRYYVDNAGDLVVELAGEGSDYVYSSLGSYTLTEQVERMYLLEGSAARNGVGNALDNLLTGNIAANNLNGGSGADTLVALAGNDMLDGGTGTDKLFGGLGDDTYVVDNTGDVVSEVAGEGTDTVWSSVGLTLKSNVERLTLTGGANVSAYGNTLDNILTGNSGNNVLDGGAGTDRLIGGMGNDTYVLDVATDLITEAAGAGTDTVHAGWSYTLGVNLENLLLTGSAVINGYGNSVGNVLTGNNANNVLDGKAGADTLIGGLGDDRYYVDNAGDTVIEGAGNGDDYVYSQVSFSLSDDLERLYLTEGSAAQYGMGNDRANTLTGNSLGNTLSGGLGNDLLVGGLGNDSFLFSRGDNADTIKDIDATAGNTDVLSFLTGIAYDQLWFLQSGASLVVKVIGTSDKVTVQDWFSGANNHLEQIRTTDGSHTLLDSHVQSLVTAMAALTLPTTTTLTEAQHTALDGVVAAAWS